VVTLASRVMVALLPPGRSSFMLGVSAKALLDAGQESVDEDLTRAMVLTERIINAEIERKSWRAPTNTTLQQLIVAGNAMEQLLPDNTIRVYRLDQYVVCRSPSGKMVEFIIADHLDPNSLPDELKALYPEQPANGTPYNSKGICLYTWGRLEANGKWRVHQELEESVVPDSEGTYDDRALPFFALRWTAVAGEDYGRSKVEEHLPDLRTFDGLRMSIRDGAAMASRNITLVRPNAAAGMNLLRKLKRATNGDIVIGNPDDVQMLQFTNNNGLQITQVELEALRQELSAAFLATQGATRDAERVTATEIRMVAQEIEGVLGGTYSMLSQDMQAKRINRLIIQMQANGQLPEWPEDTIEPTILTGLEALGRENEVSNVAMAKEILNGLPEGVMDYVKWEKLLKKGFNGLDLSDAVRTDDEVMQRREQEAQMQMVQDGVAKAAAPVAAAAVKAASPQ
jgi:hypothetical protein